MSGYLSKFSQLPTICGHRYRRVTRTNTIQLHALVYLDQRMKWRKPYSVLYSGGKFLFVHLQLLINQGLTADGGRSVLGKLLRARPLTFLGYLLSVHLFLSH